ncbi:MAG TPA: phosphatase PAP2 family protein [Streptosporangiaceae bacterium]|nr:phosphatase PAP2 family protein [Streptosporangiaceae bacterium]
MIGCAVVVAGLGILFADQARASWFDHVVDSPIISTLGVHGLTSYRLASPGTLGPAVLISGAIAVICLRFRRINGAVLALLAVPVSDGLDDAVLKPLFGRTDLGQLTYPSGHTTAVFAMTTTVAILLLVPPQQSRTRMLRVLLVLGAVAVSVIVAVAVIALEWHYFTDTIGGATVAIGTVSALAILIDLLTASRWLGPRLAGLVESGRFRRPDPPTP